MKLSPPAHHRLERTDETPRRKSSFHAGSRPPQGGRIRVALVGGDTTAAATPHQRHCLVLRLTWK